MPAPSIQLSFVIPLCNEEATLTPLFEHIKTTVDTNQLGTFEVIFVDDGSTDSSWQQIEQLKESHPDSVTPVRFRRNRGKAAALSAGFAKASGEIVITMDADLQDEPTEIPNLISKLNEGFDCVSGWKQVRHDPLGKTLPSKVFNWITAATSGVKIHDFNCGFKAYRAEAIHSLNLYGELHRYIPVLLAADGYTTTEIIVEHHPRTHGVSKYGWNRLIKGGLDLITVIVLTRYLKRPGHFFGGLGLASSSIGFFILAGLSIQKICFGVAIGNRPLFFLGILLLLLGVQLVSVGLVGELISYYAQRKGNRSEATQDRL